jgi:hypothetical protein
MLNHITDDELVALYWKDGLSGKEIAKLLGCSSAAVCMRMKASGIKARHASSYPPSDAQRDAWRENGKKLSSYPNAKTAQAANGKKNKGKRKQPDYEFGGHEKKRGDGYIKVYVPDHPHCTADGYVMKHILVMEKTIGRFMTTDECVHHINHIRDDNRIENLRLMTKSDHMSMHMKERHANRRKNSC